MTSQWSHAALTKYYGFCFTKETPRTENLDIKFSFAMSFHMSLYSLEGPVSLSERGMDSFTPSPLDRRQLRSVMQEFFSFHLIMRHDEKYVYIYVSVIIIIIISNCGMSFSMI